MSERTRRAVFTGTALAGAAAFVPWGATPRAR